MTASVSFLPLGTAVAARQGKAKQRPIKPTGLDCDLSSPGMGTHHGKPGPGSIRVNRLP
jgi:hypothetical protein